MGRARGGAVGGLVLAIILVVLSLRFTADQIFAGFVLITFAQGLTSFLFWEVMGPNPQLNSPNIFSNWGTFWDWGNFDWLGRLYLTKVPCFTWPCWW